MSAVREQMLVDAPISVVWKLVGDPRRYPEWLPRVFEIQGERFEEGGEFVQVSRQPVVGRDEAHFLIAHTARDTSPGEMRNPVVTRIRQRRRPRPSRNLEERLIVRFPALYQGVASFAWRRLSPRSRLRRALLHRQLVSGWAAFGRRDYALQLVRYAPDAEYEVDPAIQKLLGSGAFVGYHGVREGFAELAKDWQAWEPEPKYMLDFGDRLINLGSFRARGRTSGLELERELLQVLTVRDGLVTRDQVFLGWEDGMRATGLDPDIVALASRLRAGARAGSTEAGTAVG